MRNRQILKATAYLAAAIAILGLSGLLASAAHAQDVRASYEQTITKLNEFAWRVCPQQVEVKPCLDDVMRAKNAAGRTVLNLVDLEIAHIGENRPLAESVSRELDRNAQEVLRGVRALTSKYGSLDNPIINGL